MANPSHRDNRGFTLVELMMAILILTVGLLGLLQSIVVALQHNTRNRLREEAMMVAEEQMNSIRANSGFSSMTVARKSVNGIDHAFTVVRDQTPMHDKSNDYRLTVTVTWGFHNVSSTHQIYSFQKR
ncbi:prepilin-type N-terminal cleavage/methylation domain-containing protein [Geomonas sp. Red32]|uniref:type IV pilus modification PilV family protein n=1 Tax=Geomonas sp. Red32 TaxID=2912856 RepID=UPI00202D015D|nr:prepilin-type N-terminal cleavage/methylation domain-containing protein [Geomonas sp. Red32]MCM0083690.1 prepilin-type N-terminal cleavage/methylation domain-containing protein [Geomonas sp. Red32]